MWLVLPWPEMALRGIAPGSAGRCRAGSAKRIEPAAVVVVAVVVVVVVVAVVGVVVVVVAASFCYRNGEAANGDPLFR